MRPGPPGPGRTQVSNLHPFIRDIFMGHKLRALFRRLASDTRGVTLVEYGIAIALAILLGATAFSLLADEIAVALGLAGSRMPN